jgi:hypothetical protein
VCNNAVVRAPDNGIVFEDDTMGELQRVQVLIGASQRKKLARIARREGTSVSELMRELIERGLEQRSQTQPEWQAALRQLRKIRLKQMNVRRAARNFIAESRRERVKEDDRVWRQS